MRDLEQQIKEGNSQYGSRENAAKKYLVTFQRHLGDKRTVPIMAESESQAMDEVRRAFAEPLEGLKDISVKLA